MPTEDPQNPPVPNSPRERVRVFDTTLRDGEQAPGFSMTRAQKLRMANALADLGVDTIEAGFPQASDDDFAAVQAIAREVRSAGVCGLARCQRGDIETAARALEPAARGRIHVFIATSPLHREFKLGMSKDQVIDAAVAGVRRANELCGEVEFSAEDAMRTEPEYLAEVFAAVIEAGATTLNVPDTVGYTTPAEMHERIRYLRGSVRGIERAVISVHCHDDLGMAVANSLAAVAAGARQVECTLTGIGERAGNAALEEIAMALKTRAELYGVETGVRTPKLYPTARLLAQITGHTITRNKAIVGENAFAHESGIHQHGMLKHRGTYEIMRPEDVGFARSALVLGKHSGRHALRERLSALGFAPADGELEQIFARFKALADRKREVFDSDLEALALGRDADEPGPWHIVHLHAASHLGGSASASVRLQHEDGRSANEAAIGDGPVDATLRAIGRAVGHEFELTDFQIRALSEGGDAQGQANLGVRYAGKEWRGRGVSTDIVEATAHAALEIANRIERHEFASGVAVGPAPTVTPNEQPDAAARAAVNHR
ncbi:2-isopropylmalate synthase [Tahibacter amnicola]|uniref:2-isopropylmalate synthase n=1 Tax=Tahibacter amnicola TaxID=2976241 RepID=A0ABY6BFF5_9GAMM|nr:2-isopropylmalate synthase [Tahibacter amnicola]UXI68768.1 2-isopropylmalate synthase [Tahibacter amnicola]